VSALISVVRGDYTGAALSVAAIIPIIGDAAGATKIARRLETAAAGRLGNSATRRQIAEIATTLEERGYIIINGGQREECRGQACNSAIFVRLGRTS
jgi:hypothetical protein